MADQIEMLSLIDVRVATTKGHVIPFEARKPRMVPADAVQDCMARGCAPTATDKIPVQEDVSRAKVEFQGDVRRSMLYLTVKLLAEENDVKNFDSGGYPKSAVIANRLGFEVPRKEIVEVFQQYNAAKAEGTQVPLHAAASQALEVLQAEDKAELLDVASEMGVDNFDKLKGMQLRELRKTLLVKLSGAAL
jgi:hypothetical protein